MDRPTTPLQSDGQGDASVVRLVDFADLSADHPVTAAELDALERLLSADLKTFLNP